jgi:alkaline phosphatase D
MKEPMKNAHVFLILMVSTAAFSACKDAETPTDAGFRLQRTDGPRTVIDGGVIMDSEIESHSDAALRPLDALVFPETIDQLTISIRTGTGTYHGTNDNALGLCLSENDCFVLNVAGVDDFRRGEVDVYHFEGINLPRSDVNRVEIRSRSGDDRWVPACMQIQFDGEQVYCNPEIYQKFGNDVGEVENWTDPDFLHLACTSCYASPLTHGPMIGAVHPDAAHIWLRSDATREVKIHVYETGGATVSQSTYTLAENDYAHTFRFDALVPDTRYSYRIEIEDFISQDYSFKTGPENRAPVKYSFSFGSCAKVEDQSIFSEIAKTNPDLFLFIGDNHYANSNQLNTLRWFYRWSLERPERLALAQTVPTIAIWDDHDFTGNNSNGYAMGKNKALRVFKEYWANPGYGLPETPGVFFNYRYGDTEFFMLDDRYYRGLDGTMLGQTQTNWLLTQLASSTAVFKFLVIGSQWTSFGSADSWAAFPQAAEALYSEIENRRISGVVLISGDIHRSEFRAIVRTGSSAYDLPELTSSPLANSNSSCRSDSEQRDCVDEGNYFIAVDVDTTESDPRLDARIIHGDGTTKASWSIRASELRAP